METRLKLSGTRWNLTGSVRLGQIFINIYVSAWVVLGHISVIRHLKCEITVKQLMSVANGPGLL